MITHSMQPEVWGAPPGGVGLVGTFLGVVVSIVFTRVMGYFLCKLGLEVIEFALEIFNRTLEDVFLFLLGRQIIGIL